MKSHELQTEKLRRMSTEGLLVAPVQGCELREPIRHGQGVPHLDLSGFSINGLPHVS